MKRNKGFTLIELLIVVAIIALLSAIVLAVLSNARNQSTDTKIKSQLKSMLAQASLYAGTIGTAYIVPAGVSPTSSAITGAATGGTVASGTLFNDTTVTNYGLYNLLSKLPSGTNLYYGWDGKATLTGAKWFVAAGTSGGAVCVDYTSVLRSWNGTTPATTAGFIAAFPSATVVGNYSCQ
jgi:prepilin-type N-terminal cleavage/methylation domain-containing protein